GHLARQQLAGAGEDRVLALDLPGVDAALDQDHRPPALARRRRIEDAVLRQRQRQHRPPLGSLTEGEAARPPRLGGGRGGADALDLVIPAGADVAAPLTLGDERIGERREREEGDDGEEWTR